MLNKQEIHSLESLLQKGQVYTDISALLAYEADGGVDRGMPDGVALPHTAQDVARIALWAAEHHVPLIGRGAGTGLSGGAVAEHGGLIVEFSRMNRVLELDTYGRSAVVEPGIINLRVDEQVRAHGLYFPPDPASQRASTIGGNVSENSGGPHCFKYGVMTNYVTGMQVVLADGSIVQVGGRAFDYPEYDFCGTLTGSEGMLALMTAINVRLVRNPPGIKTMLAVFDSVEQAGIATSAVIATGLVPATMEMMDQKIISIVEAWLHAGLPTEAAAMLIIEVDGYPESLDKQIEEVAAILRSHGGHDLRVAGSDEERNQIWLARKSAAGAIARLAPAHYTVDITVPRSRLAETLLEVNEICERYNLPVGYVFHAGDGNLHPLILIPDVQDEAYMQRVHDAGRETVEVAIRKDGSLSGEHGVGIEKRAFMPLMFNETELSAMLDIKSIFDPHNLLNPGKIFPSTSMSTNGLRQTGTPDSSAINYTPTTTGEAAQTLAACAHDGLRVHITGEVNARRRSPTERDAIMRAPTEVVLSTSGLRGIKVYAPDDLYITVGAGTPLAEVQAFLAEHHRFVPVASPWQETSVGGLIATNLNAPLRMRYGSLRDLVLSVKVALADGRVMRVGRPVMKNVAGFDLVKLFVGSHGTLGLITEVTLKYAVQPRARRTLFLPLDDLRRGLLYTRQLLPASLVASAVALCNRCDVPGVPRSPYTLIYTAEGIEEDVQAELDQARDILRQAGAPEPVEIADISGTDAWVTMLSQTDDAAHVRIGLPLRDVPVYAQDQSSILNTGAFFVDSGNGFIYVTLPASDSEAVRTTIKQLRGPALQAGGYAVVTHLPESVRGMTDRWGYTPETLDLMRRLKARWDPGVILNAGEFVV
ncbi:MAG TPA: FAD-linked oxidase C-terminal domain-containing protein [Ktedonobacteraceae bacterium]|nr:FAD-linked oxidase C-terminal domain-containing protein [Ktedonobacteraceae bacterium]